MTQLYLIAHKVRGSCAYDVAEQMEVNGERWWIIPTSGHRAYPFWTSALGLDDNEVWQIPPMPADLPDHYAAAAAPREAGVRRLTPRPEDL